jgi:hypothetical protein
LFGNDFPFLIEELYEELFVRDKKGGIVEGLEKGHCFIHQSIFMSVVEDMLCIC